MPRALSEVQEAALCAAYRFGAQSGALAQRYGVDTSTVRNILNRRGIARRSPILFDAEQEAVIVQRYQSGENALVIAKSLAVAEQTIRNVLKRGGARMRSVSHARRIYSCDHHFFDRIDTESKAYFLGFLAADGGIVKNTLRVVLSPKDECVLRAFKHALSSDHPIKRYRSRTAKGGQNGYFVYYTIISPEMVAALAKHGLNERKTFTLRWPTTIPPPLLRHYLRGYSDGDGSFVARRFKDRPQWSPAYGWSITSSEDFVIGCREYLAKEHGFGRVKPIAHRTSDVKILRYSGNRQVARLADLLYRDVTVWLPRKRDKVAHLL